MRIYARPSLTVVYSVAPCEICWSAAGAAVISGKAFTDMESDDVGSREYLRTYFTPEYFGSEAANLLMSSFNVGWRDFIYRSRGFHR